MIFSQRPSTVSQTRIEPSLELLAKYRHSGLLKGEEDPRRSKSGQNTTCSKTLRRPGIMLFAIQQASGTQCNFSLTTYRIVFPKINLCIHVFPCCKTNQQPHTICNHSKQLKKYNFSSMSEWVLGLQPGFVHMPQHSPLLKCFEKSNLGLKVLYIVRDQ